MLLKELALRDSNPRLADYEPAVLTAELRAGELMRVWSLEYRVSGALVDRLIRWPEDQGETLGAGKPEGAGFEPAKLFRSLPV